MRSVLLGLIATVGFLPAATQDSAFAGRWDLTITTFQDVYPSWMEVSQNGGKTNVRVVGRVASVHPATRVKLKGPKLSFQTQEWFGKQTKVLWEFTAKDGKLTGTQKREKGVQGTIAGEPAPALDRKPPAAWSNPEPLFNGKDLSGWEPLNTEPGKSTESHWKAINGELVNEAPGANIRTKRTFQDFKLHIEYNCPKPGNSGVYLRGRYEIQVAYEAAGVEDKYHGMGSIYGFLAPAAEVPARPGEWESFDVTLVGRTVTVVRDGTTIINNQEIPGITGGALDSREGEPGPLYIQGDHTGGMKYRNITISVPR